MSDAWALLLLIHVAVTWLLVGLIWTVHRVHYPLFSCVGNEAFCVYHQRHTRAITSVVGPAMAVELASTSALLVFMADIWPMVPRWLPWLGAATVVCNWLATWLLAVPMHQRLALGFDAAAHRRLVRANALRTVMWSLHGFTSLTMLAAVLMS